MELSVRVSEAGRIEVLNIGLPVPVEDTVAVCRVCPCGSCPFPYSIQLAMGAPSESAFAIEATETGFALTTEGFAPAGEYSVEVDPENAMVRFGRGLI